MGGLTGPLGSKVLGSAAWSGCSFMGRPSTVERKVLAKLSSVMVAAECLIGFWFVAVDDGIRSYGGHPITWQELG